MEYNYSLNNNGTIIVNNLLLVKEATTIDDNVILKIELDTEKVDIQESIISYVVLDSMDDSELVLPEEYFDYTFLNEITTNRNMKVFYKVN